MGLSACSPSTKTGWFSPSWTGSSYHSFFPCNKIESWQLNLFPFQKIYHCFLKKGNIHCLQVLPAFSFHFIAILKIIIKRKHYGMNAINPQMDDQTFHKSRFPPMMKALQCIPDGSQDLVRRFHPLILPISFHEELPLRQSDQ